MPPSRPQPTSVFSACSTSTPRPQPPATSVPRTAKKCRQLDVVSLAATFSAEFSLDLSTKAPHDPPVVFKLDDAPLQGTWEINVHRSDVDVKVVLVATSRTSLYASPLFNLGCTLEYLDDDNTPWTIKRVNSSEKAQIAAHDGKEPRELARVVVTHDELRAAEAACEGSYTFKKHRRYTLYIKTRYCKPQPVEPEALVGRLPDTSSKPIANDIVRIVFPHAGGSDGAELWTTAAFLSSSSSYLERRLATASATTARTGAKRSRTSARVKVEANDDAEKSFPDSDDETDAVLRDDESSPLSLYDVSQHPDLDYSEIAAPPSAYSTFRAVLRYLETGYIRFAPLSSSCLPVLASARLSRADIVQKMRDAHPSLPIPVSPKSTYRLAHLLDCEPLQQAALVNLSRQLSLDNAAGELFDEASQTYGEWRKVVLAYVVRNWNGVTASAAWKDVQARISRDEIPGVAPLLMELVQARSS
ncbi:hypothetical protein JCM8208_004902 [Rhodotorula glutinis]